MAIENQTEVALKKIKETLNLALSKGVFSELEEVYKVITSYDNIVKKIESLENAISQLSKNYTEKVEQVRELEETIKNSLKQ